MPLIKARSSSIINSVDLRGTPTAPTATTGANTTQVATTSFVSSAVSDLINSAPSVLDTLSELASAINNDESFASTVTGLIAEKVALGGDTMTGFLTLHADPTSGLHAATKDYVDNNINAITINSTDDVPEGSTNLYYTTGRVRSDVSLSSNNTTVLDYDNTTGAFTYNHPSSDGILEGSTNLYFSQGRARQSLSLNTDDNQIISYSNSTGEFTFTTPDTDKIVEGSINQYFTTARARNSISAGTNINYDSSTGIISSVAAVESVNGQTGTVVLDTDDVSEGSANLYFTNARGRSAVSLTTDDSNILSYNSSTGVFEFTTPSTDAINEGSSNLYYTDARVRAAVSASGDISYNDATGNFSYSTPSTDGVNEGSTNLYFTDSRARTAVSLTSSNTSVLSYDSSTGTFTFALNNQTSDDVAEGSDNLYFTTARARESISTSGWSNLSYNNSTGVIDITAPDTDDVSEGTNLYYTDTRARSSVSMDNGGGDGSLTYNNSTGVFTYTGPSSSDYRSAFSATASGDGSFSYDNSTGVFTYTGPGDSDYRGAISATTASGVSYNSSTGVISLDSIPNSSLSNSSITVNGYSTSLGSSVTLGTDDVAEGTNNLYFTTGRARNSISVNDGSGALSYDASTGVLSFNISAGVSSVNGMTGDVTLTTDDINEGTNNLYYTSSRVKGELSAGTGVSYNSTTGQFSIGQAVGTTDNVTFNDVTVSGDLTVQGTLTAIQSTTVEITDKNLTLAKGSANATQANGAGLTIDGAGATITYASGTDTWDFNKGLKASGLTATGDIEGAVVTATDHFVGNLTGNVTGTVSDLSNHNTDDVAEGSTNLYFTNGRARSAVSLTSSNTNVLSYDSSTGTFTFALNNQTSDDVAEGTNNLYFTNTRARASVSATTASGDGTLSYDNTTGVFTYTGPGASDYRSAISVVSTGTYGLLQYNSSTGVIDFDGLTNADIWGTLSTNTESGIMFNDGTGTFYLQNVPNAALIHDSTTVNGKEAVLGDSITLITDDIEESPSSPTNKWFTNARAAAAISLSSNDTNVLSYDSSTGTFTFNLGSINTDGLTEGSTNLFFTNTRARNAISVSGDLSYDSATGVVSYSTPSTDGVNEGTTNLYFTNTRARNAISLTTDNTDAMSYDSTTGEFSFTLNSVDTDEISEGATNYYFTTARARNTISAGSNISYDSSTGVISTTAAVSSVNSQTGAVVLDTDDISEGSTNLYFSDARAAGAISLTSDNTDILSYSSGTGAFTFATPTTDAIDEGSNNLYYTDARADARIAAASVDDLADVDLSAGLQDGYTLVWSSTAQQFVPQNIATQATNLNFTGDGTTTSFSTGVEVSSIDNTQVYVNGLIQAPTYSYTLSTASNVTSIVFDTAPEANDYIMIKVVSTSSLTAGGVLNEQSTVDGGTF